MVSLLAVEGADTSAITTAITSMVTEVKDVISAVLPIVLPVAAIIVGATIAVRLFKKFSKQEAVNVPEQCQAHNSVPY